MIPITDIRVSIPLALNFYHLPLATALFFSVIGEMLPAVIILFFIEKVIRWLCVRFLFVRQSYEWWARHVRAKLGSRMAKYGAVTALFLFVGFPIPLTGSWSGALAAFLFHIPRRVALVAIFCGICMAAFFVTLVDLGVVKLLF